MKHSTILKRCDRVKFIINKFTDYFFEPFSNYYGCSIVTFRYDSNLRFLRESNIIDIVRAQKILGAYNFIIDCNTSMILFFYE